MYRKPTSMLFAVVVLSLALSGCATQGTLGAQRSIPNVRAYDVPFDAVWTAIIGSISETNLNITTLEKASGLIAVSGVAYKPMLDADEGVRGSVMFAPDVVTARTAKFNIFATRLDDGRTSVKVNSSFSYQVRKGNGSNMFPYQYSWEEAASTGYLEGRVLDRIAARMKQPQSKAAAYVPPR